MTVSELKKHFFYKIMTKSIKLDFPFIKDFDVDQKELDTYNNIYLIPIIDIIEFMDKYNCKIYSWVLRLPEEKRSLTSIFDIDYDEYKQKISEPIRKTFWKLYFDTDIPNNLKINKRYF